MALRRSRGPREPLPSHITEHGSETYTPPVGVSVSLSVSLSMALSVSLSLEATSTRISAHAVGPYVRFIQRIQVRATPETESEFPLCLCLQSRNLKSPKA